MPTSKPRIEHELSDALLHELMAGDAGVPSTMPHRLHGWPDAAMLPAGALEALWDAHREPVATEAAAGGFVPWGAIVFDRAADSAASRTARTTWSQRFYAAHGY
ncbi:MAG TPA: hypothetical protein VNJ03_01440 [Vicinamibacterales bacterium]|nr:hypothetical protein [Vicinamibacterales bacterium]